MTDVNTATSPAQASAPAGSPDTDQDRQHAPALSPELVVQWLQQHPEVFDQHPDLLTDLRLPHASGTAVSLVERQLTTLRGRNAELRHRLDALVQAARDNDALFRRTSTLVLDLLECKDISAMQRCMARHLQHEFGANQCTLVLFPGATDPQSADVRQATPAEATAAIGHLLGKDGSFCGAIRGNEAQWLFPDSNTGSAVVLYLQRQRQALGVLAVGSDDASRFSSDMGTLFIRHLGDVLIRLLP